ncbi:homocysteine S-methyltransferase family protein [Streptomyces viridiviolaceus]|uniref:Homocysteine S-methyltransferase family protein n=1 Tax=Streptomyces viridiviolaceus TaxID=68282 RepID=A0ABW2E763_9ACTN
MLRARELPRRCGDRRPRHREVGFRLPRRPSSDAGQIRRWWAAGARMAGGCCRLGPRPIRSVAAARTPA